MNKIEKKLSSIYSEKDINNIYLSGRKGYWSNLSKAQNDKFSKLLEESDTRTAVQELIPEFEDMIFFEKREAALELLNHEKSGICIDYGCMWGVLSIGMAKRGHNVVSIDQTYQSLEFLNFRAKEEKLNNIYLVHDDIKKVNFSNFADYALVNGVLEWIPILEEVDVNKYYKGSQSKKNDNPMPGDMQFEFLKTVQESLKEKGKMLLAIENRHSYQYYMGRKDPHANLLYTTFLPRMISNFISLVFHKKEYRNYIYSFNEMKDMVLKAGFSKCYLHMAFPDYHFPEQILEYSKDGILKYDKYPNQNRITKKQKIAYYFEYFLTKYLKIKYFSPAIILVAEK